VIQIGRNHSNRVKTESGDRPLKKDIRRTFSVAGILAAFFSNSAAFADPYSDGCKSYTAHNYAQARKFFESAAAKNPNSWLVHYQLGNTYLALSQKDLARQAYEKALDCNPPAAYKGNIDKAMSYLGVPVGDKKAAVKAVAKNKGDEAADEKTDKTGKANKPAEKEDPVKAKIEARKKQIMVEAGREADKLKADRKNKRAEEGQGKFYRTTEGEVKQGFSKDEETDYNNETDRMVAKVMEDAKRKADSVLSP